MKRLLIDAISTNSGGAISHLKNILINFNNQNYFQKVDVFLPKKTRSLMPKLKNINYISPKILSKNLILRIFWQIFFLNIIIYKKNYNCVFITGSSHLIFFKPVVTISQNLLPFSSKEVKKYFFSLFYIKLITLRFTQTLSFKLSSGVIFLHRYSKNFILNKVGKLKGDSEIIHHGLNIKTSKTTYKCEKYRLIYVSNIDFYKNQIFVLKGIDSLILKYPHLKNILKVEFYGSSYKPALKKFHNYLYKNIKNKKNFRYFGLKNSKTIYRDKKNFDTIFLFASSCENFSVSLIEGMSRGYAILCVNLQPMRSVLGNSALFYKYNSIESFQKQLKKIISFKNLQNNISKKVYKRSKNFSDKSIAKKTYKFLIKISKKYEK